MTPHFELGGFCVNHSGRTRDAGTPNGVSVCDTWGPTFGVPLWGVGHVLGPNYGSCIRHGQGDPSIVIYNKISASGVGSVCPALLNGDIFYVNTIKIFCIK